MNFPANFLDELRTRTPIAGLIGKRVRLTRSGREQKGCCPFHNEKTPSFYVYDDHFHCFGCGAHGDAISFVMQSEGASFTEAVERLAGEAGMEMPKADPRAAELASREAGVVEVLARAAADYQRRLLQPEGAAARAYLAKRGLEHAAIERFGLGWSGEGRGALLASLAREGVSAEGLVEAGLMKQGERGPVDYFYGRLMFPISDRRGRVVSFGGRLLGAGEPKYLNGPETAVFSKGRTLYGMDRARAALRQGARLVVVEGYMDVIALHEAGFGGAVAPLGTALTEMHWAELWRVSPMPVLCLDGDKAGRRATLRAIERALPSLAADRSLMVARLPDDEDPDSVVRKAGAAGFAAVLAGARSLDEALFGLLAEGADQAGPEGRAALRRRLEAAAAQITDRALASEMRRSLLDRFFNARPARPRLADQRRGAPPLRRSLGLPRPVIAAERTQEHRARILLGILLKQPALIPNFDEALVALDLPASLTALRAALIEWANCAQALDSAALVDHLRTSGFGDLMSSIEAEPLPSIVSRPDALRSDIEACWYGIFGLMNLDWLRDQCAEQHRRWRETKDAGHWDRLVSLTQALRRAERGESDEDAPD
ncbi:MAG TPA: DNA primase [Acidiphilium sp.]|nr:MAG: DNA primase [Acidiphilium sp. 21-60-14]OYV91651.1 MAG: DNA primase [Acidiphilium sp. 37-60-79]HQT87707.1 DNA primase [Acidiphilium sp.]HQU22834.1 DNA primase [Acidiphilium sp.]